MTSVALHHRDEGDPHGPPVLLAPSLGTTTGMWDELATALREHHRVIRIDTRGHGNSPVPDGPYTVTELADDVLAVVDRLGIERFDMVGLSLGGAIAQTLALQAPERLGSMVLACTGPSFGDPANWWQRAADVRTSGMSWLVEPSTQRWFPSDFPRTHPERAEDLLGQLATTPPEGYAGCCEALAQFDVTEHLGDIGVPTRVIIGADDQVSPPSVGRTLRDGIPNADLVVIDEAAHIANVAQPDTFNTAVLRFVS